MASRKAALLSSILIVSLFVTFTEARDIMVGGKNHSWKIPSSESDSLNKWAEASRFRVGDTLVWTYDPQNDSVLQVIKKDYETCNTSSPVATYRDGNTKVKLEKPGPYYFISGADGHCEQGQKLVTVVMSTRRQFIGISPAPSPVEFEGPAVAPTSTGGVNLRGSLGLVFGVLTGMILF
ncbi:hypothetical protein DKX38_010090 [Salix brachista]|uniref:Phytocyanin domain-containing protein n=1 Tax=Salix brachista TaxID=2182728 RepID=A0A5N5MCM0_9ROSI|nr:hypothetical protein DKX38_010090 [Salix brachista]